MSGRIRTRLTVTAVTLLALLLTACGPGSSSAPDTSADDPVRLGDQSWESLWINNAIAGFIIEHGYGREVEIVATSTPVMQQAIVQGDIDVVMEIYPQNIAAWWDEVREDGTVLDLGFIMEESRRGFYVPRYVIEGDPERGIEASAPGLRSFADLADYPHVFPDPEAPGKGQIVSCIIGWACLDAAAVKAELYGLSDTFNMLEPGSSAAMDTAIVSAYRAGEPVVFYYWEPTWLVGEYDLVQLEMDPWTEACEAAMVDIIERDAPATDGARCAFPEPPVSIAASAGFGERDPELVAFLTEMYLGIDRVSELTAWMNSNEAEADEVALHYLDTYRDEWRSWLPSEVADNVDAALDAAPAQG